MEAIEERVVDLESALAQFMATSRATILDLRQMTQELKQSNEELKRANEESRRSNEELRRANEESRQSHEESRQTCARLDRSIVEIRQESRRHTLEMAHIADRIGRFCEDIVAPNLPRIAAEAFGITDIELEAPRIKKRHIDHLDRLQEFDFVLAGNRQLLVASVKSTAHDKDATDFVRLLKDIFSYFPEFQGYTLVPILASMALRKDLVQRLTRLKLYGLALGQRTMELVNLETVRARSS